MCCNKHHINFLKSAYYSNFAHFFICTTTHEKCEGKLNDMPTVTKKTTPKTKVTSPTKSNGSAKNGVSKKAFDLDAGLQEYFGFNDFKGNQRAIIESLLAGNDTFVIKPTGGGKSLCYQLPAILSPGCAIIVSPLIALMKNQVDLVRGYSSNDNVAHFLNSTLNKKEIKEVHDDLLNGRTKML